MQPAAEIVLATQRLGPSSHLSQDLVTGAAEHRFGLGDGQGIDQVVLTALDRVGDGALQLQRRAH